MIADMIPRVREALSVDDSYDAEIIPFGIQRAMKRLLRDYHFPWSVRLRTYEDLVAGSQSYSLPAGFKKELLVHFYDTDEESYSEPLLKREGFTLPSSNGVPHHYWFTGGNLWTDIKLPAESAATTHLLMWYESIDWESNEEWFTERFEDLLFTFAVFRLAAEKNKAELAQIYGSLWQDDRQSLAIYANELEFDNGIYMQREAVTKYLERYPAS